MYWLTTALYLALPAIAAAAPSTKKCPSSNATPSLPPPIPIFDVPSTFANVAKIQDANIVTQILNTLSLYPASIDGKDFKSLSLVYTENALFNASAPIGVLNGLKAITAGISGALANVDTQHAYGTQLVEVRDACSARTVSYFTASHFGRGSFAGEVAYAYGQYQDNLIKTQDDQWRIQTRSLVYMGPFIGNLSLFGIQQ